MSNWQKPLHVTHRGPSAEALLASLAGLISVAPDGSLVIECGLSKLEVGRNGILITSGPSSIRLNAGGVSINDGALEVR